MPDPRDFSVRVEPRPDGAAVVVVAGEVDLSTGPELDGALRDAAAIGSRLVVDLSACTFLSSTGLRALIEAEKARPPASPRIRIVVADPHLRKVFEIAGIDSLFDLVDRDEPDSASSAAV